MPGNSRRALAPRIVCRLKRRRFILRGCLLAIIVLAAGILALAWYLSNRAGETFADRPEALLPPETAAVLSFRDLSGTLDALGAIPAVRSMRDDLPLGGWLMTAPVFQEADTGVSPQTRRTLAQASDRFLRRYFGREFTLALLPADDTSSHSTLVVIVQAQMGFEENLGELALLFNPAFAFESKRYGDVTLRRSPGSDLKKSFAYCRLGSTIILALRTDRWEVLESIIDQSLEPSRPSLQDAPLYVQSMEAIPHTGLSLFARPSELANALRVFPSDIAESPSWNFWFDYLTPHLTRMPSITGHSRIDQGFALDLRLATEHTVARPEAETSFIVDAADALSSNTLAFLGFEHPALGAAMSDVLKAMAASEPYRDKLREFEDHWKLATGSSLQNEWFNNATYGISLGVTNLSPGILGPIPQAVGALACKNDQTPEQLSRNAGEIRPTLLGIALFQADQSVLRFHLNGGQGNPSTSPSLLDSGVLGPFQAQASPLSAGVLQISHIREALEISGPPGSPWSGRTAEKMEDWRKLLETLNGLDSLRMRIEPDGTFWMIKLHLLVE